MRHCKPLPKKLAITQSLGKIHQRLGTLGFAVHLYLGCNSQTQECHTLDSANKHTTDSSCPQYKCQNTGMFYCFQAKKGYSNNSELSTTILSRAIHKQHCGCSLNVTDTELAEALERSCSSSQLRHRSVSADGKPDPNSKLQVNSDPEFQLGDLKAKQRS